MAKELALQQALALGPAVDGHEGAEGAGAAVVDGRATSSLPVPVSPAIKSGASVAATSSIWSKTLRMAGTAHHVLEAGHLALGQALAQELVLLHQPPLAAHLSNSSMRCSGSKGLSR